MPQHLLKVRSKLLKTSYEMQTMRKTDLMTRLISHNKDLKELKNLLLGWLLNMFDGRKTLKLQTIEYENQLEMYLFQARLCHIMHPSQVSIEISLLKAGFKSLPSCKFLSVRNVRLKERWEIQFRFKIGVWKDCQWIVFLFQMESL